MRGYVLGIAGGLIASLLHYVLVMKPLKPIKKLEFPKV
jgi:hypothetical protein